MTDAPAGLLEALQKLPPYVGITWRGAPGALSGSIPLPAPLPTSRDPRVASSNFTAGALWAIVSVAGRDVAPLSADPAAREIAILPGSTLTPASALHPVDGVPVQVVLEVRDGMPVGDVPADGTLADLLVAARAEGDVEIRQPGRFG